MTNTIIFATGNQGKFDHMIGSIGADTGYDFIMRKATGHEIQSASVRDVCLHKALEAFKEFNSPVLVHDVGMHLHELNGFPGAYFKDFVFMPSIDVLHRMLNGFEDRRVSFQDWMIYVDANGTPHEFMHDTQDVLRLCNTLGSDSLKTSPMNRLIAFSSTPDIPASDDPDFMGRYDASLIAAGITPCWTQFRQFLMTRGA